MIVKINAINAIQTCGYAIVLLCSPATSLSFKVVHSLRGWAGLGWAGLTKGARLAGPHSYSSPQLATLGLGTTTPDMAASRH